ncbi:hypothetical protein ONZ45_g8544 [Pleurotus djamor]|nr:hypothetical protein ONZ45_g8544 [Pleurotus djamor]
MYQANISVSTNTNAQDLIDKEIADLESAIRALKTRRNTHAAIAQLPDEILSLVFVAVRSDPYHIWWMINEVCTQWRAVALRTPHLWTDIPLNRVDRARVLLKRAKSAPLKVSCILPCPFGHSNTLWSLINLIMSPECHVRTLNLRANEVELLQFLTTNSIHSQGPSLESLHIYGEDRLHTIPSLGNWDELPKLKALQLMIPIPVKLPFLPSLTQFTCFSAGTLFPVSSGLRALACMPAIENIYISDIVNDPHPLPTSPITLRALKHINVTFADPVSFMGPHNEGLELRDVYTLCARVIQLMRLTDGQTLDMKIEIDDDRLEISFTQANNLQPLFDALPTERFTSLICEVNFHSDFMDVILRRLPHTRHLTLSADSETRLSPLFLKLLKTNSDTLPPLPELQYLTCDFHSKETLEVLERILRERQELGIPMRVIST